jgi:hypothetical protein
VTFKATFSSVVAATCLLGATPVLACGTGGYSYAGVASSSRAFGIGATVTPLAGFDVRAGHVAAWVGVGGPRTGPNGTDEWLQTGFSGFPGLPGNDLYYELALPGKQPEYHQLARRLPIGRPARIAVLEMHARPNVWRVWLNGRAASEPIYLPGSHGRWAPIATAESWDGGTRGRCNGFLYRFDGISLARVPGGGWHRLARSYEIKSPPTRLARSAGADGAFLAAEGRPALFTLASLTVDSV